MSRFVALLRAVNVAGHGSLSMAELRAEVALLGYERAATYLQSGNVVFDSSKGDATRIEAALATALGERAGRGIEVLVRRADEFAHIVAANPFLGEAPASELHATFLKSTPERGAIDALAPPDRVADELSYGDGVVYVRCRGGYARTKLNNAFIERRMQVPATTRNWNTVVHLLELARS